MLKGALELGYSQLIAVNGGCGCSFSGSCGGSSSSSFSSVTTVSPSVNGIPDRDAKLTMSINGSMKSSYVYGKNDCDIWVQEVLKNAGCDITSVWGDARNNTVADHEKKLAGKTTDYASTGWNVVLMTDSNKYSINHCGLANVQSNGTVLFYQNSKSVGGPSVEQYSSVSAFQKAYAYSDFDYYKI